MKRQARLLISDIQRLFREGTAKLRELEKHLQFMSADSEIGIAADRRGLSDTEIYSELTGREKDVLRGIALGASNKELAAKLDISEKTVKNHLSNIFQKLQVSSRTQAALFVFREKSPRVKDPGAR